MHQCYPTEMSIKLYTLVLEVEFGIEQLIKKKLDELVGST